MKKRLEKFLMEVRVYLEACEREQLARGPVVDDCGPLARDAAALLREMRGKKG